MDIKLKNIKYSLGMKVTAAILVWLCFLGAAGSGIFLLYHNETARSNSYFETGGFRYRFENLIYDTVEARVNMSNTENTRASAGTKDVTGEKARQLDKIKRNLSGMVNYMYYIKGSPEEEVFTNIKASNPAALIEKQPVNAYFSKSMARSSIPIYEGVIDRIISGTDYEVYVAIQEPLKPGDFFYDGFMNYSKIKMLLSYAYITLIASLVLLAIAAVYLAIVAGRKEKGGDIVLLPVDRLYTDVHTLLVLAAAFLSVMIVANSFRPEETLSWIIFGFILSVDAFIGISYVLSMIRQAKAGRIFSNTLVMTLARLCFSGKIFRASVLLVLLGYGLINGILFDYGVDLNTGYQRPLATGLLLLFNAAAVYFAAKALLSLSQIMVALKEIASGNLDYPLNSPEISAAFSGMAKDISNIQCGLKKAVAEAVKGERMKTELITNVSHDLKTPLTSIVNYVDLLKREDLNNQKAAEYVSILEEKSGRLKQLVDDLVEASKASSGSLTVNAEKVDLNELVMQACGEFEEKIRKAQLDIRINSEEKNTYIYADGKQMWRIIENVLSNAVKYSMPQSRVYVNIEKGSEFGILTIKNMSAYPLDIPPEQLTERFVRGDVSRTTEGSGLGLSIAQSLTHLQGGRFKIEIDGDLFKINIAVPLYIDEKSSMD